MVCQKFLLSLIEGACGAICRPCVKHVYESAKSLHVGGAFDSQVSLDYPWASPFLCLQCIYVILGVPVLDSSNSGYSRRFV